MSRGTNARVLVFRSALDELAESLEAHVRLQRWPAGEAKPEPLVAVANKLVERLGTGNRMAASRFHGPPADATQVAAMVASLQRLDAAYLSYRQRIGTADVDGASSSEAVTALELEIVAAMG